MSNNLILKKRIIFIDNISSIYAEKYSKNYPNAVFFTNEGDIYKGGLLYTRIKGINPDKNSLTIDGKTISLIINNNLLEFTDGLQWYWYVGHEEKPNFDKNNIQKNNSINEGWRKIENCSYEEEYKRDIEKNKKSPFVFNPNEEISNFNKPIFYTIKNDKNNTNINYPIKIDNDNLQNKDIYIYLPELLISKSKVGIYDALNNTNFISNEYLSNKQNGIENISNDEVFDFGGIKYKCYKISNRANNIFNLCIYAKE